MTLLWTEKPQNCYTGVWKLRVGGAALLRKIQ